MKFFTLYFSIIPWYSLIQGKINLIMIRSTVSDIDFAQKTEHNIEVDSIEQKKFYLKKHNCKAHI